MNKKIETINNLLSFEYILVFINPKVEGTKLPDYLMDNDSVTLRISRFFKGSLELKDDRIEAVLKFNGIYYPCILPADSIWGAMTPTGQNVLWLESAPDGVLPTDQNASERTRKDGDKYRARPLLRRIK
ncbi:MAG: hypothetical protein QXL01_05660 [Thermoplasmatales archaeon]